MSRVNMNKDDEERYLLDLWDKGICPTCGKKIPDGTRVGSGKKSEGGFCNLDCYVEYHQDEIIERQKKILKKKKFNA